MRSHLEAVKLAGDIRDRASTGELPDSIANDLELSGDYVRKILKNERAFDKNYMGCESVWDLRRGIKPTQARILRSIGLKGKTIAPYLGVCLNRVYELANSGLFNKRAQVTITLTQAVTVDGKKLQPGIYALSAYERTCSELLIMGNGNSKFVKPFALVGKVELANEGPTAVTDNEATGSNRQ